MGMPSQRVALTFDDGPGPYTHAVLDVLARHGVIATFFVVGRNAERHPRLVHRIADEGHVIASHSLTHPDPWTLPLRELVRDYRDGRRAVEDSIGASVPLFRPPKGHLGLQGAVAARLTGSETWLWTKDAADWEGTLEARDVVDRLTPLVPGDVVLLHDGLEKPMTPSALDRSAMVAGLDELLTVARDTGIRFDRLAAGGHGPVIPELGT